VPDHIFSETEFQGAKDWVKTLVRRMRMEYGSAMAMQGLDPDLIIAVQQDVARNLVEWFDS
jgi:hypothetical protein